MAKLRHDNRKRARPALLRALPESSAFLVATAATATAGIAAAASAAAAAAVFLRLGLVDGEGPAVLFDAVQRGDRRLCFGVISHLDKSEALASAGVAIGDDLRTFDGAVRGEKILECRAIDFVAQVTNV